MTGNTVVKTTIHVEEGEDHLEVLKQLNEMYPNKFIQWDGHKFFFYEGL